MNRISQSVAIVAFALAAASATATSDEENSVWRMSSGSTDGDKTYYTVWCTNKSIASVIAEHDKQLFCALPKGGKRRCDKQWDLNDAAIQACRKSR